MASLTLTVTEAHQTLAAVVRGALPGASWNRARDLVKSGRVVVDGVRAADSAVRLAVGAVVTINPDGQELSKGVLPPEDIVYVDSDVVVVSKRAGLLSVPFDSKDRDTLVDITRAALRRQGKQGKKGFDPELGVVHRIDVDTTGLLLFTRNLAAKKELQQQFRVHSVHRRYLAIAHGVVRDGTVDTVLLSDRGDGIRGSYAHFRAPKGPPPADARQAVTHLRCVTALKGASLVECRLETGRQHQIRIHLSEGGHPLVGEKVYIRDYTGLRIPAQRPMLHAQELGFEHPRTGEHMRFSKDPPADFAELLATLRP